VLAEAAELVADGAIELNIIAQDTTSYGCDLPQANLPDLLRQLDRLEGVEWLRLMYTYPLRFDEPLIETLASARHVVPYVDMPLQHISSQVLRRMGRGVESEQIVSLLARLRQAVKDISIRTTLIVGFPGETEADFDELLHFVRQQRFEALGVFAFSPEPGTPAADMPDQLPEEVKQERLDAIMRAQQEISLQTCQQRIGSEMHILVDGYDEDGVCIGRHRGQAPDIDGICYLTEPVEPGSLIRARIVQAEEYDLIAEPLETIRPPAEDPHWSQDDQADMIP
jgi:ribosomal protein S12 methylthiotransferase